MDCVHLLFEDAASFFFLKIKRLKQKLKWSKCLNNREVINKCAKTHACKSCWVEHTCTMGLYRPDNNVKVEPSGGLTAHECRQSNEALIHSNSVSEWLQVFGWNCRKFMDLIKTLHILPYDVWLLIAKHLISIYLHKKKKKIEMNVV